MMISLIPFPGQKGKDEVFGRFWAFEVVDGAYVILDFKNLIT